MSRLTKRLQILEKEVKQKRRAVEQHGAKVAKLATEKAALEAGAHFLGPHLQRKGKGSN
jgi:hypothetical protein